MSHVCFTKARRYCLLFLAALFLCACAAGAEEVSVPPVSQAESASSAQESSHTPAESFASSPGESSEEVTSEESAEDSSAEESSCDESSYDESSEEASLPEPTPPADATLTPAGEFKVGNDGSFIYGICCSRTAFPAEINTPVIHGVDDQGEIYAFWNQQVIRLSDGANFSHHSQVCEAQILFCGGDLSAEIHWYTFENSGIRYTCPVEDGLVLDVFVIPDSHNINGSPVPLDGKLQPIW